MRRYELMRRLKYLLIALTAALPLLAAAGFFRMAAEISAKGLAPRARPTATERAALAAWRDDLTTVYICAIIAAIALGRLRAFAAKAA